VVVVAYMYCICSTEEEFVEVPDELKIENDDIEVGMKM